MSVVLLGAPILVLALARGALRFLGDAECPAQKQVQAEISRLNPAVFQEPSSHLALLQLTNDGLDLRLFDSDGHLLEERLIRGSESCAAWARTAAVVLVTWEAELAGPTPSLPSLAVPTPVPTGASEIVQAVVSPQPVAPVKRPHLWVGELGIGLIGSVASDGQIAPGIELRAALERAGRPYGGELTLFAMAPREVSLAQGSADWGWLAVGLGGHVTFGREKLKLELAADALAGLLLARGVGFPATETSSVFDPGLMASARIAWTISDLFLAWFQIGGLAWLKAEQVEIATGPTTIASAPLPRIELIAILGFSLATPL